jgi:hypothetical protein
VAVRLSPTIAPWWNSCTRGECGARVVRANFSFAPSGLTSSKLILPTAYAVGFILAPLRGFRLGPFRGFVFVGRFAACGLGCSGSYLCAASRLPAWAALWVRVWRRFAACGLCRSALCLLANNPRPEGVGAGGEILDYGSSRRWCIALRVWRNGLSWLH